MTEQKSGLYWLATGAAALGLLIAIANIVLVLSNQGLQRQVSMAQQNVNGLGQLLQINRATAIALANHAVANKDDAVPAMLMKHGIKITVKEDETPAEPAAPAAPAKK